jgi:hypothetical protein
MNEYSSKYFSGRIYKFRHVLDRILVSDTFGARLGTAQVEKTAQVNNCLPQSHTQASCFDQAAIGRSCPLPRAPLSSLVLPRRAGGRRRGGELRPPSPVREPDDMTSTLLRSASAFGPSRLAFLGEPKSGPSPPSSSSIDSGKNPSAPRPASSSKLLSSPCLFPRVLGCPI